MANTPTRKPTWQEKLDQGLPLNSLEETKADADFNYRHRLREAEERAEFERLKNRGSSNVSVDAAEDTDDKKGGK